MREENETERERKRASERVYRERERASERNGEQEAAIEKERERTQGLIEEGKRKRESKRAHVIPECRKFKASANRSLARSFFLSLATPC